MYVRMYLCSYVFCVAGFVAKVGFFRREASVADVEVDAAAGEDEGDDPQIQPLNESRTDDSCADWAGTALWLCCLLVLDTFGVLEVADGTVAVACWLESCGEC